MLIFRLIKKRVRRIGITLFWLCEITGLPRVPEHAEDEALSGLTSGPMDEEELERMRKIGEHVHETRSVMSMLNG